MTDPWKIMKAWLTCNFRMGLTWGVSLRSRFSATAIIDHIARGMRSTICKTIVQNKGKVSILLDESTTLTVPLLLST